MDSLVAWEEYTAVLRADLLAGGPATGLSMFAELEAELAADPVVESGTDFLDLAADAWSAMSWLSPNDALGMGDLLFSEVPSLMEVSVNELFAIVKKWLPGFHRFRTRGVGYRRYRVAIGRAG